MIVRLRRGKHPRRLLDYILRSNERSATTEDRDAAAGFVLLNSGCASLASIELSMARAMVEAVGMSRPDLKNSVAHIVLAPDPLQYGQRSLQERRAISVAALHHALMAAGLGDRLTLCAFHRNRGPAHTEHMHAAIALPSPETGRSIPQHRLREKLRTAVDEFELTVPRLFAPLPERLIEISPVKADEAVPPIVPSTLNRRSQMRRPERKLRRSSGWER